jgi:hypothetical protein
MLTRIVCPNGGHIGAAKAASLPRVLICSQCGHGAFIKSGRPATSPSVARDEQAALRAAWERYESTSPDNTPCQQKKPYVEATNSVSPEVR